MDRTGWLAFIVAVVAFVAVMLLAVVIASGGNVTVDAETSPGHGVEGDPGLFYLFNRTHRTYSDVLQWRVDESGGCIWVQMRAADGVARYLFTDKEWARLYLDGSLVATSALNLTLDANASTKVKFDLGKWAFTDRGETLEVHREVKTKDHSLNESWVFRFRLGTWPKITFYVKDLDAKAKEKRTVEWRLKVSTAYCTLKARARANTTDLKLKAKGLEVDWSDFGARDVQVEANASSSEWVVHFHPAGRDANYTVDPSVGLTPTTSGDRSWVVVGVQNSNNVATSETLNWEWMDWWFYDGTDYQPIDCNPYPVDPDTAGCKVRFYDAWGRSWDSSTFDTGAAGSYTYVTGELPVCWLSVRTSDMVRDHDAFHAWNITFWTTTVDVDRPLLYPVVVDESNPTNWVVGVPEDAWIQDAGTETVYQDDLVGRTNYVVYFNVTLKTEPTSVWLRMYDNTTGEGIPWETFVVMVDGALTPTDVIQAWTYVSMTVVVQDHFGGELYNNTTSPDEAPLYLWRVPLPVYSVKFHNQNPDYVHKLAVYYNLVDGPYEFYAAPLETCELHLRNGTYRIRWTPYRNYVAQTTRQFDLAVTAANYFLVNGTTISRVVSDVAGVYSLQQVMTNWVTPDVVHVGTDLPRAPCWSDMAVTYLYKGVKYIHPYAVLTAELSYNYTGDAALLWTPHKDLAGRNYTIDRDRLYFSGPYGTRVLINWTGNGTTRFDLSALPASLDLGDGGNYTVWTNNTVDATREVTFREYTLFWWTYYTATSKYEVDIALNNTMNLTLRRVNWLVAWPENRSIDLKGVSVYDVNNGVLLTRGEHYDVTEGGVYMYFESLAPGIIRTFTVTAWDHNTTGLYDTPVIPMTEYSKEQYKERVRDFCQGSWTNDYSVPYSGSITVAFKFEDDLDPDSIIVLDRNANREVPADHWVFQGRSLTISGRGVGTIPVGGTASYRVYFDRELSGEDGLLFQPILFGLSPWTYFVFLAIGFTYAMYHYNERISSRFKDARTAQLNLVMGAASLWALIVITYLLHVMEVIA